MTLNSYLRGHKIELNGDKWVYSDTKEPTAETWQNRPCGHCGQHNTTEGHDACLGVLPKVINACCGHGDVNEAYIMYEDHTIIRGEKALDIAEKMKGE